MTDINAFTLVAATVVPVTGAASLIVSWRTFIQNSEATRQADRMSKRSEAAKHHLPYSRLLEKVRAETAAARHEISRAGLKALSGICEIVESPQGRSGPRRTEHLIGEACELTENAIAPELVFQSSANLRWRLNGFNRMDWSSCDELRKPSSRIASVFNYFKPQRTRAFRPEYELWMTPGFRRLMRNIEIDVSQHDPQIIRERVAPILAKYHSVLSAQQSIVRKGHSRLQSSIVRNKLEQFSLEELSPSLFRQISEEAAQLDLVESMGLPEHEGFATYQVPHMHAWIVFFALILYLAGSNESWQFRSTNSSR